MFMKQPAARLSMRQSMRPKVNEGRQGEPIKLYVDEQNFGMNSS